MPSLATREIITEQIGEFVARIYDEYLLCCLAVKLRLVVVIFRVNSLAANPL